MTTCPIPRQSQIITNAPPRLCGEPATVQTMIPMTDSQGRRFPQLGMTCLYHSVSIATWKLIENLKAYERQNPPRIIVAG